MNVVVKQIGPEQGEFVGLPNQLNAYAFNFTPKDIYEDAQDVLNVLITMYDSKGDGQINLVKKLPTEIQFSKIRDDYSQLITDDPSKYYDIVGKLG